MMIEVMNQEKLTKCKKCGCITDLEESEGEVYHWRDCLALESDDYDPSEQYARDMYDHQ